MSQENVDVVRRAFELNQEGVRRGDFGAAFDKAVLEGVLASDLKWRAGRRRMVGMDTSLGRDGYVENMRRWTDDFDDFAIEAEKMIDADNDHVVVIPRAYGTGKGSGALVELRYGMVFTLEGRRIVSVDFFPQPNDALEAVGLRE